LMSFSLQDISNKILLNAVKGKPSHDDAHPFRFHNTDDKKTEGFAQRQISVVNI
jgi:hypothetical protein